MDFLYYFAIRFTTQLRGKLETNIFAENIFVCYPTHSSYQHDTKPQYCSRTAQDGTDGRVINCL